MRKTIFHIRLIALTVLAMVATLGLFSEPTNNDNWLTMLFISKSIGFAAAYVLYRCIAHQLAQRAKRYCDNEDI